MIGTTRRRWRLTKLSVVSRFAAANRRANVENALRVLEEEFMSPNIFDNFASTVFFLFDFFPRSHGHGGDYLKG